MQKIEFIELLEQSRRVHSHSKIIIAVGTCIIFVGDLVKRSLSIMQHTHVYLDAIVNVRSAAAVAVGGPNSPEPNAVHIDPVIVIKATTKAVQDKYQRSRARNQQKTPPRSRSVFLLDQSCPSTGRFYVQHYYLSLFKTIKLNHLLSITYTEQRLRATLRLRGPPTRWTSSLIRLEFVLLIGMQST